MKKSRKMDHENAPEGFRWVFCRFRRVRNSDRVLDAHDYGHESWAFKVREKRK